MKLEILSRLPEKPTGKPPLLFVHGAWLAAWCWDEHFLPFFAARGYPAYAVSLRGHGASQAAPLAGMADYAADVAEAMESLPAPPVLIGHSMGGGVVQRILERRETAGGILLAAMPPHGMSFSFLDAMRRHPWRWMQANLSMNTKSLFDTPDLCREFFFSPDTSEAEIVRSMERIDDEPYRALLDMTLPTLIDPARIKAPLLVLGGEQDVVIPPRDVRETARRYGTEAQILPGQPHAMMLDVRWREAAEAIDLWLSAQAWD